MRTPLPPYPASRPRRLRRDAFTRALVRENRLACERPDPAGIRAGRQRPCSRTWPACPACSRRSARPAAVPVAEECVALGIPVMALFPVIDPALKYPDGREAFNPEGLVPRTVRELKRRFPELGVLTDVALDPFTSHGQDGLLDDTGYILNDETVAVLRQQALVQAEAGVDIVAPSDMMDGRIGAIRSALEAKPAASTRASWRTAPSTRAPSTVRSATPWARPRTWARATRRSTRWTRATPTRRCARVALDIAEGADMVMVKPGMPYLDIVRRVKDEFRVPTFAYQVSGEYAMLKAAAPTAGSNTTR